MQSATSRIVITRRSFRSAAGVGFGFGARDRPPFLLRLRSSGPRFLFPKHQQSDRKNGRSKHLNRHSYQAIVPVSPRDVTQYHYIASPIG
jgi:hypothetical protein